MNGYISRHELPAAPEHAIDAESSFATLKKELIHRRSWPTKAELRSKLFDYIEIFFNRRRRHGTLGMLSPAQYETITNNHHLKNCNPPKPRVSTEAGEVQSWASATAHGRTLDLSAATALARAELTALTDRAAQPPPTPSR